MSESGFFNDQFLIAMPSLEDENFNQSVTLLCEHNGEGALGVIINRPTDLTLKSMLDHMGLDHSGLDDDAQVFWGGPVQPERGFVIHDAPGNWEATLNVEADLFITTSRDILMAIGSGRGPSSYMVTLGYAGWAAGQLEQEILSNAWLNTPVDRSILFAVPIAERWQAATRLLGVDVVNLSGDAGHA